MSYVNNFLVSTNYLASRLSELSLGFRKVWLCFLGWTLLGLNHHFRHTWAWNFRDIKELFLACGPYLLRDLELLVTHLWKRVIYRWVKPGNISLFPLDLFFLFNCWTHLLGVPRFVLNPNIVEISAHPGAILIIQSSLCSKILLQVHFIIFNNIY